jgi:NADPH2:quinone reductase
MKALVVDGYGPPQNAHLADVEIPKVRSGSLLVRMEAAGVNPFDYKLVTGMVKDFVPIKFPYIPGMDGAGEVVEAGDGVEGWQKGDAVVGFFHAGTFAQYAVISAADLRLARKPSALNFERAAAIPEAGFTAKTAVRAAGLNTGQTVLVIGATGGVGLFVTQLAKAEGAHVIATGKQDDADYLRQLGVDETIDYKAADTIAQVQQRYPGGVDVVIDLINAGDALLRDGLVLRKSGTLVSTLNGPDKNAFAQDINVKFIQQTAQRGDLEQLLDSAADGTLRVEIAQTYDLAQASQALADLVDPSKHTRGKLVIRTA